jgi:glycosyltransferase involved in cell wall biosynthesis
MDVSVVIPLYNEEESLPELVAWIKRVMDENHYSYEVILIDDGSNDTSWKVVEGLSDENPNVKGIKFRRNYGKSAALNVGFAHAQGEMVVTMDADLQDSPDEIPEFFQMIHEEGYDVVSGWKKKRHDPLSKTIPTKFFNAATRKMSGIHLHDFNCGLKAYRLNVVKCIEVYGEMHRYIPVLAKQAGFTNITEKVVQHRARKYGKSKFGMSRFINGFLDLMTITFLTGYGKKPMHFFGLLGTFMFIVGSGLVVYLGAEKLYYLNAGIRYRLVTESPLFYISLTSMILGTQLFLAGFLGELVSRSAPERNHYEIESFRNTERISS